ncbi:MAG: branched-chain amino acid aminotransferase [Bacilli bacterium]
MSTVITLQQATTKRTKPSDENNLGFSKYFTDHMFTMNYTTENGWHNPAIVPYSNLSLSPSALVLHYGQTIFEGLKAYRTDSGTIQLFRPEQNLKRLNASAARLCIPEIDEAIVLEGLRQLIAIDSDWVPSTPGTSLYIRPTIIATDEYLGVNAGKEYLFYIVLSPVGHYFANGFQPTRIYVEDEFVRAVRGGTGNAKTAGNYAASLLAGQLAAAKGFDQVLWLDGVHRKYVEEVGAMNVFFVFGNEIVTPPLTGSILPGITRDSVLTLAKHAGYVVSEREISIDEVIETAKSGELTECFGTGTAAVISPIGEFFYKEKSVIVSDHTVGPITQMLYETLVSLQSGKTKDTLGWIHTV